MKKKALVNIKLGNQLLLSYFYLIKNGFRVYHDIGYDGDDPYGRNFELKLKNLKLDLISPTYKQFLNCLEKILEKFVLSNHENWFYQDLNFFDKEF